MPSLTRPPATYKAIHYGIADVLQAARTQAARSVNALMTASYWETGRRIVEAEQQGKRRAGYGEQLIERLSIDLTAQFGRGFGVVNLSQMRKFYELWPIFQTVSENSESQVSQIFQTASEKSKTKSLRTLPVVHRTVSNQRTLANISNAFPLPWSAYVRLLSVKDEVARSFYETEALRGGWSMRQLDRQIGSQFYQRTALSRNKIAMLSKGAIALSTDAMLPDEAVKDPFFLEFLNLKDEYSETDLESALIHKLEDFLLELGSDFTFVGRQRRLRIDHTWFRIDLLFYHRRLRCLVIIDLKLTDLTHADVGQMHLYCNFAKANWMLPGENPPVGLILCAHKGASLARYALDGLPNKIMAGEYKTLLPQAAVIEAELDKARRELEGKLPKPATVKKASAKKIAVKKTASKTKTPSKVAVKKTNKPISKTPIKPTKKRTP